MGCKLSICGTSAIDTLRPGHILVNNWESGVKPILYNLKDITDDQALRCYEVSDNDGRAKEGWQVRDYYSRMQMYEPVEIAFLLKEGFDLFDLIPSEQALDGKTYSPFVNTEAK